MKLLTIGSLPPEWGGPVRGGVATFHATLLDGLRRIDADIELGGVVPPEPLSRRSPIPAFVRPPGVPIDRFYEELLARVCPDVVLMNHVAHTIGVTHARLPDPPPAVGVVHSWHNITYADPAEVSRRKEVTQEALDGLAAAVVGSRHCLEEGRRLGLRYPAIAEVIHYPLQPVHLAPELDLRAPARDGVLFLGSLVPRKNPEVLIEVATRLPGVEFTLAGEGELEGSLREMCARRGLGGRVHIVGHFPLAEHLHRVRELLSNARVLCLPSRSESFGLVFIEALACGTPVVGFGPTVREIRDEIGIEIGEPLDGSGAEEVTAALRRVLSVEWDRAALRRAALDSFGPERATRRYAELLMRVGQGRESIERPGVVR